MSKKELKREKLLRSWAKYNANKPFFYHDKQTEYDFETNNESPKYFNPSSRADLVNVTNYSSKESVNRKVKYFCPNIYKIDKIQSRVKGSKF